MSSLIVEVCPILDVIDHPNADKLEIVLIKGWQCVVRKGLYKKDDIVVYAPIDSVIPIALSDALSVTEYLSRGRVKTVRLRGEYSQGLIIPLKYLPSDLYKIGDDVKDVLGITKYEPPIVGVSTNGVSASPHPNFPKYTSIENIKNFPDVLEENELVVISEKVHGSNMRVGKLDGKLIVGSHNVVLKDMWELYGEKDKNIYWKIARRYNLEDILEEGEVIYGEVFGKGVQKGFDYGLDQPELRIFDVMVDLKYLSYKEFTQFCTRKALHTVPVITITPWNNSLLALASGESLLDNANHIKEGIVIKPCEERFVRSPGRVILKHISEAYLLKNKKQTIAH